VHILLTNDDGIYAPGLSALQKAMARLGEVSVVAPATEQSGVGHSITYLTPLMAKEVFDGDHRIGWAVEGSPADCVKLALGQLCPQRPELVVSGINGGLNVGINVLYSGTVAAATEGAVNDIPSIAVSLEYEEHADVDRAAELATDLIEQVIQQPGFNENRLYSINIPTVALHGHAKVRVVPMAVAGWEAEFEPRIDPKGRRYFWSAGRPPAAGPDTDVGALQEGYVTITPLSVDRTARSMLGKMQEWDLAVAGSARG
jgi:5'-nucleotidase